MYEHVGAMKSGAVTNPIGSMMNPKKSCREYICRRVHGSV